MHNSVRRWRQSDRQCSQLLLLLLLQAADRCAHCIVRLGRQTCLLLLLRRLAGGNGVVVVVAVHAVEPDLVFDLLPLLLRHSAELDRISRHAQRHTLLQPAVLTPIPIDSVDDAILLPRALVIDCCRLAPPEEPFAPFAGDHSVMHTGRLVAAHFAGDDLDLS